MKKMLTVLLAILCMMSLTVVSFAAEEPLVASGLCGDNAFWSFDEKTNTLTISGEGAMADYESTETPWRKYCLSIKTAIIGNGITRIGGSAFECCENLVDVTIPDSVECIGIYAFAACYALPEVTIPGNVSQIESYAFIGCSSLKKVYIINGAEKYISTQAFDTGADTLDIYFNNTKAQWRASVTSWAGNEEFMPYVTVHCTDGDIVGGLFESVIPETPDVPDDDTSSPTIWEVIVKFIKEFINSIKNLFYILINVFK